MGLGKYKLLLQYYNGDSCVREKILSYNFNGCPQSVLKSLFLNACYKYDREMILHIHNNKPSLIQQAYIVDFIIKGTGIYSYMIDERVKLLLWLITDLQVINIPDDDTILSWIMRQRHINLSIVRKILEINNPETAIDYNSLLHLAEWKMDNIFGRQLYDDYGPDNIDVTRLFYIACQKRDMNFLTELSGYTIDKFTIKYSFRDAVKGGNIAIMDYLHDNYYIEYNNPEYTLVGTHNLSIEIIEWLVEKNRYEKERYYYNDRTLYIFETENNRNYNFTPAIFIGDTRISFIGKYDPVFVDLIISGKKSAIFHKK
jgi:hypothetical protein